MTNVFIFTAGMAAGLVIFFWTAARGAVWRSPGLSWQRRSQAPSGG
jgi:hypothetical protein